MRLVESSDSNIRELISNAAQKVQERKQNLLSTRDLRINGRVIKSLSTLLVFGMSADNVLG